MAHSTVWNDKLKLFGWIFVDMENKTLKCLQSIILTCKSNLPYYRTWSLTFWAWSWSWPSCWSVLLIFVSDPEHEWAWGQCMTSAGCFGMPEHQYWLGGGHQSPPRPQHFLQPYKFSPASLAKCISLVNYFRANISLSIPPHTQSHIDDSPPV